MLRAEIICQSKVDAVAVLTAPLGDFVGVLLAVPMVTVVVSRGVVVAMVVREVAVEAAEVEPFVLDVDAP